MSEQVNPEEVRNFLKQASAPAVPDDLPPETEVISLDELKAAQQESDSKVQETFKNVEEQRSKLFEPDKASLAHLSSWVFENENLKVEVEDMDKSLYLKALLNDSELQLDVTLDAGITLRFRALTNFDFEAVFAALNKMAKAGEITGPSQYASRVQQAAAALQLVSFGGKTLDYVRFDKPHPKPDVAADKIIAYIESEMSTWGWPKWQCIVTGLRIFETKLAMCNENIRNGNFWKPADIA